MTYEAMTSLTVKTPRGVISFDPGQTFQAKPTPAMDKLLEAGKVRKVIRPDVPAGSFYLIAGQVQPVPTEDIPLIQRMPYDLLKTLPPTALYIWSKVLDDHIWLITSPELINRLKVSEKAVYLLEEIARLLEQNLTDPESIKSIHMVKTEMAGGYIQ